MSSVASKIWTKSSRAMIEARIAGERDPKVLTQMAKSRMRAKISELEEAFGGNFGSHHALVCRQVIEHIDFLDRSIEALTTDITERCFPFESAIAILCSISGVSRITAEVMVAEMGVDMTRFPTPGQLCAWAGVGPRQLRISRKAQAGGHASRLDMVAACPHRIGESSSEDQGQLLLGSVFKDRPDLRIARSRGTNKATVAVAHSILNVAWHLLTNGVLYNDPGARYFELRHDPAVEANRLQRRSEALGFEVTLTGVAA